MTFDDLADKLGFPEEWTTEERRARLEKLVEEGLPFRFEDGVRQFNTTVVRDWLIERQKATPAARPLIVEKAIDAAQHLGITPRTLQNWKDENMPWAAGHYDIREIEAWREKRFGSSREKDEIQERGAAETRLAVAKANKAELEFEEFAGRLIPVDGPKRVLVQTVNAIRTHLEQFPERLRDTLEIEDRTIRDEVYTKCRVGIDGLLRAIQAQLRSAGDELAEVEDADQSD